MKKTNVKMVAAMAVCLLPVLGFGAFDAKTLQAQIDAATAAGGGTVVVPKGTWETGPLALKSNVTLHLEKGAVLRGDPDPAVYKAAKLPALIHVKDAENVAITGEGTIDGRGGMMSSKVSRPHLVNFWECRNVKVEGVTLRCGGSWTLFARRCDGVVYRGVKIWSHLNHCEDGMDVSSRNVLIEDCDVDADDDALVFKTSEPDIVVENVEVRNCRFASSCNAIKFGTESHGRIRNVNIHDCTLVPPSAQGRFDWRRGTPGVTEYLTGISAIAVESVDGEDLEDVTIRNITLSGYQVPIFVRFGHRRDCRNGRTPLLRNVLFENITGSAMSRIACSITGVAGRRVENVTLRNVTLDFPGGGVASDALVPVPEVENRYPEARMFHCLPLPAYAFYVRHADGVRFEKVTTRHAAPEGRPALFVDDATITTVDCDFQKSEGTADVVRQVVPGSVGKAEAAFWNQAKKDYGFVAFPSAVAGRKPPLLVVLGCTPEKPRDHVLADCLKNGWAMLLPFAKDAPGVLAAIAKLESEIDVSRILLRGDGGSADQALALVAAAPTRFAGVVAVMPAKYPAGFEAARGTSVWVVSALANPASVDVATRVFAALAPTGEGLEDSLVAALKNGQVPKAQRAKQKNPDYPPRQRKLALRREAGKVRIDVAEGKRVSLYAPTISWLAAQPLRRADGVGKRRLILAGDSTLQHRAEAAPQGSWGEALAPMLADDVEIVNCAIGGRSTRTFMPDWQKKLFDQIRPGDWVLIQFGHNDMSKASDPKVDRQTDPDGEYMNNLIRYVADVRLKGGRPLLVPSISLYLYDAKTQGWQEKNPLARWVAAMKRVANEFEVPIVDLNALTLARIKELGCAEAGKWYMYSINGKDWAHPVKAGAAEIAKIFAADLRAQGGEAVTLLRK